MERCRTRSPPARTIRRGPEEEHHVLSRLRLLSLSGLLPPILPHVCPNASAPPGPWRHHSGLSENSKLCASFAVGYNLMALPGPLLLSL